jgi:hypothetical protein
MVWANAATTAAAAGHKQAPAFSAPGVAQNGADTFPDTWEGGMEHSHQGPRTEKTSQKNDKMHTEKSRETKRQEERPEKKSNFR